MNTPVIERYADSEVIVTEGIMSQKAYIVISGGVSISKKVGKRNVRIGLLKKGDIFGEMGLFQETVRSATATAVGDVEVGIIDKKSFNDLLDQCPDDMKIIINSLIDRLRDITNKLVNIGLKLEQAKRSIDSFSIKETDR